MSIWLGWISVAACQNAISKALPIEVTGLSGKYEAAIAEAEAPITQLKESYTKRLDHLARDAQAKGELDSVMLIKTELARLKTDPPGQKSPYPQLARAQEVYHEHAQIAKERSYSDLARIEQTYVDALESMIGGYTKEGEIDDALAAKSVLEAAEKRLEEWTRLAAASLGEGGGYGAFDWVRLREIVTADQLSKTTPVGGNPGSAPTIKDLPESGALLIGFDLYMAEFGGSRRDTVRKMVPLWKTEADALVEGLPRANANGQRRRSLAKDGFAVGGITTVSEAGVRKVKFKFQPITGLGLSDLDSYETGWYGDWDDGRLANLSTNGKLPVGLDGWVGLGTGEFWLLVADPK